MLLSQNKLESLATKLLKGEDVVVDGQPDYCEGKAMSRIVEIKASEPIEKLYEEYNQYGFHVRTYRVKPKPVKSEWKSLDVMPDGVISISKGSISFSHGKSYRSYMDLSMKHVVPCDYNPAPSNSVAIGAARSESFMLSDCYEMKPQWNMYLYKDDYIAACIRIDRIVEEKAIRDKESKAKHGASRKEANAIRKIRKKAKQGKYSWVIKD